MDGNNTNSVYLFLGAQSANAAAYFTTTSDIIRMIITVLAAILTIVSLVNQWVIFYKNAQRWRLILVIRHVFIKLKKKPRHYRHKVNKNHQDNAQ